MWEWTFASATTVSNCIRSIPDIACCVELGLEPDVYLSYLVMLDPGGVPTDFFLVCLSGCLLLTIQ